MCPYVQNWLGSWKRWWAEWFQLWWRVYSTDFSTVCYWSVPLCNFVWCQFFLQIFVPLQNGRSTEENALYLWPSCYWNWRDLPAHEDLPVEPSPSDQDPVFPGPLNVLCEDDIIGARACLWINAQTFWGMVCRATLLHPLRSTSLPRAQQLLLNG